MGTEDHPVCIPLPSSSSPHSRTSDPLQSTITMPARLPFRVPIGKESHHSMRRSYSPLKDDKRQQRYTTPREHHEMKGTDDTAYDSTQCETPKNYLNRIVTNEEKDERADDQLQQQRQKTKKKTRPVVNRMSAVIALNASAALDGCDDQLLPASFRALEKELKFHPSLLGQITLTQTMASSLSCPFWGYLADRYRRRHIMSVGMISWGVTTILLAFVSNLSSIMALRAMNGFFLGSIGPISQSLLADIAPQRSRGFQFGLVQMFASGGRLVGGVVTTSVSFVQVGGISGWRWTFLTVGILSVCLGLIVGCCVGEFSQSHEFHSLPKEDSTVEMQRQGSLFTAAEVEQNDKAAVQEDQVLPECQLFSSQLTEGLRVFSTDLHRLAIPKPHLVEQEEEEEDGEDGEFGPGWPKLRPADQTAQQFFKSVITESCMKPSILVIIIEGVGGTIPWSAMSFLTMYFQYCGLSDTRSGCVSASLLLGSMISGPVGGLLGDRIYQWSPNHGRPFLGQLSMLCRIPLILMAFFVIPPDSSSFVPLVVVCLLIGLCSVAGVVVNRPLLSDLVRPNHRGTTFAVAVAIESAVGALLGAPIVGILAEKRFGYIPTDLHIADISDELRRNNARALAYSLLCLTGIPWMLSFVAYGVIHLTYGPDRDALREKLRYETSQVETSRGVQYLHSDTAPLVGVY